LELGLGTIETLHGHKSRRRRETHILQQNAWYSGNFRASAPRPIRAANTVPGSGDTTVIGGTPDSARRTRDDDNVRLPHGTPLPGWDPPRLVGERRRGERAGL